MNHNTVIQINITVESLEELIRKVFQEEVAKQPERLYTAKEAMQVLGIADHRTFNALGIQPKLRGKRKYYQL